MELTIAPQVEGDVSSLGLHPVGVAWDGTASPVAANDGAWSQGFLLDVARLKPGVHNMLVSIVVPGQEPVTAVRPIRVIVGG